MIEFASAHLPTLAWYETVQILQFVEDPTQVRDLNVIYTQVYDEALSAQGSLNCIRDTAEELS